MVKVKKSWADKLQPSNDLPKIVPAPEIWGGGKMYIPAPIEVNEVMGMVPKGKLLPFLKSESTLPKNIIPILLVRSQPEYLPG